MNDTTPEAAAALAELFRQRSGSDRVRMMSEMFEMARRLVIASIKALQPNIDESELGVKVVNRFYASDFTAEALAPSASGCVEGDASRPISGSSHPLPTGGGDARQP